MEGACGPEVCAVRQVRSHASVQRERHMATMNSSMAGFPSKFTCTSCQSISQSINHIITKSTVLVRHDASLQFYNYLPDLVNPASSTLAQEQKEKTMMAPCSRSLTPKRPNILASDKAARSEMGNRQAMGR
jgi:hypothetical protein